MLALRLAMGWAFALSGATRILGGIDARGYLLIATTANGSSLADLFASMGNAPWFVSVVNVAEPWSELAIGLALLVGAAPRLGAFVILLFYFGNLDVAHGIIDGDFAYMLAFLAVAAFGPAASRASTPRLENYEVGGETLVECYPVLEYLPG